MKKDILKHLGQVAAAVVMAVAATPALASSTWLFGNNNPVSECNAAELLAGNCTAQTGSDVGSPNLTGSAYSTTGSSGTIAAASLVSWSGGLGVQTSDIDAGSSQHAIDNNGYTDMVLLDFGGVKIDLNSVKIGWNNGGDADISLFRYIGSATTPSPLGLTVSTMLTGSWELVGNYATLSVGIDRSVNTTDKTSSWWLISAYNSSYGRSSAEPAGGRLGSSNDYFKLLTVAGNVVNAPPPSNGVPEPGSLALMGAAMMGFVASRRRKQQAA